MIQDSALKAAAFIGAVVLLGTGAMQARADDITFVNGAVAAVAGPNSFQSASPTTFGGPTVVSANDAEYGGTALSTTTATYQASGFNYTLTQSFTDPDSTGGVATGYFYANTNTTYALTDPGPVVTLTAFDSVDYFVALEDANTDTFLYYDESGTVGGSLTGVLTAGDEYFFSGNATMRTQTDPTLTYAPSISFGSAQTSVTPEPSSFLLLGTGMLGAVGVVRRRLA